jgi:chloramphenicol O-acetyltransferase type A
MIIGTSAMTQTELDCIVNQYTDQFCNPMVMWGKYRKGLLKTTLPVSFQFHHVQMDGGHAARFLQRLQDEINGKKNIEDIKNRKKYICKQKHLSL